MVAAPADLRTKKADGFSPQALQGFWSKIKIKVLGGLSIQGKSDFKSIATVSAICADQ